MKPFRWEDEEKANCGVDELREEFRHRLYGSDKVKSEKIGVERYIITAVRKGKVITVRRKSFEEAQFTKRVLWRIGFVAAVEVEGET